MLNISKLYKFYDSPHSAEKINIFEGLNLQVKTAETVSIMGRSGCGKSTLLSLIAGLDNKYEGDIVLNGKNLQQANENELALLRANEVGIVFQQYHLMEHLTALENIMLPLEILNIKNAASKASQLLQKVGLSDRQNHFPAQLSGGEKQRISICRAIVSKRSLILADEPTGNLDDKNSQVVSKLFFELVEIFQTALIIVTHSLDIAKLASRVLKIENRKIVAF